MITGQMMKNCINNTGNDHNDLHQKLAGYYIKFQYSLGYYKTHVAFQAIWLEEYRDKDYPVNNRSLHLTQINKTMPQNILFSKEFFKEFYNTFMNHQILTNAVGRKK